MNYEATSGRMIESLVTYGYKKDIPKGGTRIAIRVNFGLYGYRFALRGFHGLLCKDGTEMPVHIAHLRGIGAVIGPKDLEAARHRPFAEAWRASYAAAINERMALA